MPAYTAETGILLDELRKGLIERDEKVTQGRIHIGSLGLPVYSGASCVRTFKATRAVRGRISAKPTRKTP
jgi:hypothetical protein